MTVYELNTNEGIFLVHHNPSKYQMRYLKAKIAQGYKLSEVIFCWCPRQIMHNAEGLVNTQEFKATEYKTKLRERELEKESAKESAKQTI